MRIGKLLPPDRPASAHARRRPAQHLRPRRACTADDDAHQCRAVRLHPARRHARPDGADAGAPHPARSHEGPRPARRHLRSSSTTRPASTAAKRKARAQGTDIAVPPLENYAWRLWDYWERQLDPDLFIDRTLRGQVGGKVVLVTGGSSGIGKATTIRRSPRPAPSPITIARDTEQLERDAWLSSKRPGSRLITYVGRHRDDGAVPKLFAKSDDRARRRRYPGQQRRALDPPRHRKLLRPLPRFRAHHGGQLLRRAAPDHGPAAGHARQSARGTWSIFLQSAC